VLKPKIEVPGYRQPSPNFGERNEMGAQKGARSTEGRLDQGSHLDRWRRCAGAYRLLV